MKVLFNLLFLLSFLGITSCSKKEEEELIIYYPITPEEAKEIMTTQSTSCQAQNNDRCPEGMARLFIADYVHSPRSGACTGFLISNKLLITNNHCVKQYQCQNVHINVYAGGKNHYASCKKVVASKRDHPLAGHAKLDYTILELNESFDSVDYFKVNHQGFLSTNSNFVKAWVIDHVGLYSARIVDFECFISRQGPLASFLEGCSIIRGNSGSPILNQNNEVIGVLFASDSEDDAKTPMFKRRYNTDHQAIATDIRPILRHLERAL